MRREIETIGKLLKKKQGYFDWCKANGIDPETGVEIEVENKDQ